MADIFINPSELDRKADEMEQLRRQHLDVMRRLRVVIRSVSDVWQGEAQNALVASFLAKNQTMNEFSAMLEQYEVAARRAVEEAMAMDRRLRAKVARHK